MNDDYSLQLSSILSRELIRSNIYCQNKISALKIISKIAAKKLHLPVKTIFEAILVREKMGSTGIGSGIAMPHGKLKSSNLNAIIGIFLKLEVPIDFNSIDNRPVDLLFTLLIPDKQRKTQLYILSKIAKKLADKFLCHRLRKSRNEKEIYKIITEI